MTPTLRKQLVAGDKQAFRRFYRRTYSKLFGYLQSKLRNAQDAEEILHDVYLSFLDSLPLFRGKSSLTTYLYSIARHEVADFWRKQYAKKAIRLVPFIDQVYTEELYSRREMEDMIGRVYAQLRKEQVQLLVWKYEEKLSVKEMASRLEVGVKVVESRLFRARRDFQLVYVELSERV